MRFAARKHGAQARCAHLPSGITLKFKACEGGCRLLIAGRALLSGNREILFGAEGRVIAIGAPSVKKLQL